MLKEYTTPLRDRMIPLQVQLATAQKQEQEISSSALPNKMEILEFAKQTTERLKELNFETKRGIITQILTKVIGSQERLEVYGHLPIMLSHVALRAKYRHSRSAKRR